METGSIDWRRYYKLVWIECLNLWCKCEIATIGLIELLGHSDSTRRARGQVLDGLHYIRDPVLGKTTQPEVLLGTYAQFLTPGSP